MPRAESLTRAEIRDWLDRTAPHELGMSGDTFLSRLKSGELDECEPKVARLALLARLLPPIA